MSACTTSSSTSTTSTSTTWLEKQEEFIKTHFTTPIQILNLKSTEYVTPSENMWLIAFIQSHAQHAKLPTRDAYPWTAGWLLYSASNHIIPFGNSSEKPTQIITGIANIAFPTGLCGRIVNDPRAQGKFPGLFVLEKEFPESYRGNLLVPVVNCDTAEIKIKIGDPVGMLVLELRQPVHLINTSTTKSIVLCDRNEWKSVASAASPSSSSSSSPSSSSSTSLSSSSSTLSLLKPPRDHTHDHAPSVSSFSSRTESMNFYF